MTSDVQTESTEDTPPLIAYRSLVYDEAQRLYELAVLLVEDPDLAMQLVLRALDRTWTSLQRRQLFMDVDEATAWAIVREAAQRRGRSTEVRGYQPPTTSNDRHVTAVGIVSQFAPEQAAAVYQVGRLGSSYQYAGTISGTGEQRARDIVFSARQEYREVREAFVPAGPLCSTFLPLLSARVDGQVRPEDLTELEAHLATCPVCQATARIYEDFNAVLKELRLPSPGVDVIEASLAIPTGRPDRAPQGWGRLRQIIASPWGLIPFFIVGAVILRQCTPPPVEIGLGRTTDLVYARASDGKGIMVLDAGSGRELHTNHLPLGVLASNGVNVYSDTVDCGAGSCRTTLTMTDTATGANKPVAVLDGRLHIIAVGGAGGGAPNLIGGTTPNPSDQFGYLADEDADWNRLVAVRLSDAGVQGTLSAPPEVQRAFGPDRPLLLPAEGTIFTLAHRATGDGLNVLTTDLRSLRVTGSVPLDAAASAGVSMTTSPDGKHLYVYLPAGPTVLDIDRAQGRVGNTVTLRSQGAGAFAPTEGALIVASPDGELLYCVLPTAGVAVLRRESLEPVRELGTDRRYRSVGVSTDGGSIYTLGFDGTYRVIEAVSGKERVNKGQVRADTILQVTSGE